MEAEKRQPPAYWVFFVRDSRTKERFGPYKTRDEAEAHIAEFEEDDAAFAPETQVKPVHAPAMPGAKGNEILDETESSWRLFSAPTSRNPP